MQSLYKLPAGPEIEKRIFEGIFEGEPGYEVYEPAAYSREPGHALGMLEAALDVAFENNRDDVRWSYSVSCDGNPPNRYSCQIGTRSPVDAPTLPLAICYAVASFFELS